MQRFFPLPWLALSSAGVIVKLLHWSSWHCRSRSQLCSLLGSPDSCRDESCYPHPKGLGCENQENPRCHSAVQLCVGSARGAHRGGPGGALWAPRISAWGIAPDPLQGQGWRKWRWRGWRRRWCLPGTRLFSGCPVSVSCPFPYCPHPCRFCPKIAPRWEAAGLCHELEGGIIER